MNLKIALTLLWIAIALLVKGQNYEGYILLINEANALFKSQDYTASADKYEAAFAVLPNQLHTSTRYDGACAYALAGNAPKALHHLFLIANAEEEKYRDYDALINEPSFSMLHKEKEWEKLISIVLANKEALDKKFDKKLATQLEEIRKTDQKYRQALAALRKEGKNGTKEWEKVIELMDQQDKDNLVFVEKEIQKHGWIGPLMVGESGSQTVFLVIQHSDLETQQKYLPLMRVAVEEGKAYKSDLAMLEDRVAMREGRKQIYGSQIRYNKISEHYYIYPIDKPEKVDQRRAAMNLCPIADYISAYELTWDLEKHKVRVAEFDAKQKK